MKIINTPKFNFTGVMITIFMGGFSTLMESQLYAYIAIVVLTFLLLNSDRNYAFYSVLGTVFFWEAIRINGLGMGFYFSFILLFKFLIDQRNYLTVGKAFQVLVFLMIFLLMTFYIAIYPKLLMISRNCYYCLFV